MPAPPPRWPEAEVDTSALSVAGLRGVLHRRVDVQPHVVDDDRLAQFDHDLVHERVPELLGQMLDVRAEHDRGQELARVLGLRRRRREPALGGREPGRTQPRLGVGGVRVVPRRLPVPEVGRIGLARQNGAGPAAQLGDVALSPALGAQPPAGPQ